MVLILLYLLFYCNSSHSSSDFSNVFTDIIKYFLIVVVPIEIVLTTIRSKLSNNIFIILSGISIPIVVFGTIAYFMWTANITNVLVIPNEYKKDYLLIVYNKKGAKSINPNFSLHRKRVIKFSNDGIYYTSTSLKSSLDQINNPSIYLQNGKKLQGLFYGQFHCSNGVYQGVDYIIIDLAQKIIYNDDSLFVADKINFATPKY